MSSSTTRLFSDAKSPLPEPPEAASPGERPPVVIHKFDWEALGFPEYKDCPTLVFDNLLTAEECQQLVSAAEASTPWQVAAVNGGPGDKYAVVDTDYRNSDRILFDSFEHADLLFQKLKPYLTDIDFAPAGKFKALNKKIAFPAEETQVQLSRLNERLRFLRYESGGFFDYHCDGTYWPEDRSEISYYTLQLYLNGSPETLEGGSTRFSTYKHRRKKGEFPHVDVMPRPGRALIFQQNGLLHCGEEVTKGMKLTVRTDIMYKRMPSANSE